MNKGPETKKRTKYNKCIFVLPGGAEGNRTPVQTYPSKAFYMLISLLFVGTAQEKNKPMQRLAE